MAKLSELKALLAAGAGKTRTESAQSRLPPAAADAQRCAAQARRADDRWTSRKSFADVQPLRPAQSRGETLPERRHDACVSASPTKPTRSPRASYGVEPSPAHWDVGQELEAEQTFLRKGLGTDVLARLRRGHWSVQGELDLHRLNRDEARDALADFLIEARNNGWRCVRVVHGKGLVVAEPRAGAQEARCAAGWRSATRCWPYCEAPRHAGGARGGAGPASKSPGGASR